MIFVLFVFRIPGLELRAWSSILCSILLKAVEGFSLTDQDYHMLYRCFDLYECDDGSYRT